MDEWSPQSPEEALIIDSQTPPESIPIARNASWGVLISIVVILLMIVVGAFYMWGQRLAEVRAARASIQQQ